MFIKIRFLKFLKKNDDGGARGARTPDLFAASEALSQLSYGPISAK
tara:strand:- start:223 stop:360 length:138 start_codon:yes stop_codon:yes gene_type:complete